MKLTQLIGIVGGSGSGKTTVARDLVAAADTARLISQDHYYISLPPHISADQWNFDDPLAVDLDHLARDLAELKRGESIEQPQYLFSEHRRMTETLVIAPAPVIVVEGLFLFSTPALRDVFDLKIFIDAPQAMCLERRIARDCVERGRAEQTVRQQWSEQVEPMFWKHIEPTHKFADLVLPSPTRGTPDYTAQIRHLFQTLEHRTQPLPPSGDLP